MSKERMPARTSLTPSAMPEKPAPTTTIFGSVPAASRLRTRSLKRPCSLRVGSSDLEVDMDVLHLQELHQAVAAAFAAEAAQLVAAEGRRRRQGAGAVDRNRPGLELPGQAVHSREVAGLQEGAEAVVGAVGDRDRLVLACERDDRQHRPEDL